MWILSSMTLSVVFKFPKSRGTSGFQDTMVEEVHGGGWSVGRCPRTTLGWPRLGLPQSTTPREYERASLATTWMHSYAHYFFTKSSSLLITVSLVHKSSFMTSMPLTRCPRQRSVWITFLPKGVGDGIFLPWYQQCGAVCEWLNLLPWFPSQAAQFHPISRLPSSLHPEGDSSIPFSLYQPHLGNEILDYGRGSQVGKCLKIARKLFKIQTCLLYAVSLAQAGLQGTPFPALSLKCTEFPPRCYICGGSGQSHWEVRRGVTVENRGLHSPGDGSRAPGEDLPPMSHFCLLVVWRQGSPPSYSIGSSTKWRAHRRCPTDVLNE